MPSQLTTVPTDRRELVRQLLTGGEAYATTLLALVIDGWGTEALAWHPGALRDLLEAEYGVELPQLAVDRLMAGIAVLTTDQFWTDPARFVQLANVLAGTEFDPHAFDPADVFECAWGITEALLLDPPEDGEERFSDDVRAYLTHALLEEGFVTPPDVLGIALGGDFSARVAYDYADDPALFQGVYATQQDKTREVREVLRENLLDLLGQLRSLPLVHGNTDTLAERIEQLRRIE